MSHDCVFKSASCRYIISASYWELGHSTKLDNQCRKPKSSYWIEECAPGLAQHRVRVTGEFLLCAYNLYQSDFLVFPQKNNWFGMRVISREWFWIYSWLAQKKDLFPPAVKISRFDATDCAGTQLPRLNIRIAKKHCPHGLVMTQGRLELPTFSVLDWRDNQLHHRARLWRTISLANLYSGLKFPKWGPTPSFGCTKSIWIFLINQLRGAWWFSS
jgi:hypothetical protein